MSLLAETLDSHDGRQFVRLDRLDSLGLGMVANLPFVVRVLLESVLRNGDRDGVSEEHARALLSWTPDGERGSIGYMPGRIVAQDLTGVPLVADIAAMRDGLQRLGGDPTRITPALGLDLVIDHSLVVRHFGAADSRDRNEAREWDLNGERYALLRWAGRNLDGFRVVPPGQGIIHQVNLERLATVIAQDPAGEFWHPDSCIGTDSHTTMIGGLGVLGWGVGGTDAQNTMLGEPLSLKTPEVIGVHLTGELGLGVTPTDLVLALTALTREHGVRGKFLEFYGSAVDNMSVETRALLANMGPEFGCRAPYFPIDDMTLDYLRRSGRSEESVERVDILAKAMGIFRSGGEMISYSDTIALDLGSIPAGVAGPFQPHQHQRLSGVATHFTSRLPMDSAASALADQGFEVPESHSVATASIEFGEGETADVGHGALLLAAISSCTNTSNPTVMLAAGLLAKKARERGLTVPGYVKTSFTPGSRVVTAYLERAGLLQPLAELGFQVDGYGCGACIGNAGHIDPDIANPIANAGVVAASVQSGNRNFRGRASAHTDANYLASPPLVVAYALLGTVASDLSTAVLGHDGEDEITLSDLWPSADEIAAAMTHLDPELFGEAYDGVFDGDDAWRALPEIEATQFPWAEDSTYVRAPTFFDGLSTGTRAIEAIEGARVLGLFGDGVSTDHISPAGEIVDGSPVALYLDQHGVAPEDRNTIGTRRGNPEVMARATFGNPRVQNLLVAQQGNCTVHHPSGDEVSFFEAGQRYKADDTPLVIVAGNNYGQGSSRDWAAKGPWMLGVQTVLAQGIETIHRSNLIGMGILPLEFLPGESATSHDLDGTETISVLIDDSLEPGQRVRVRAGDAEFEMTCRIDTPAELEFYRAGGILHHRLLQLAG